MQEDRVYSLDPFEIVVSDNRIRKIFDRKQLTKLVASFIDKGQKTPGICRKEGDQIILVAGERRLRACVEAKIPYRFLLDSESNPIRIREIELEENTCRTDLDFKEEARAVDELHKLKQDEDGVAHAGSAHGHGVKDTAEILNMSPTKVSEELEIAQFLSLPEVANASSRVEAKKAIKRIKEEFSRHKSLEEARGDFEETTGGDKDLQETITGNKEQDRATAVKKKVEFYDPMILCAEMESFLVDSSEKFDLVLFDPPWGVDYDEVSEDSASKESYEDKRDVVFGLLPTWLKLVYECMAENSHLYMFFGIVHHKRIYDILEEVGFVTNRIPIIWHKAGAHRTRNPDQYPGRCYEPIAFARKGKKILVRKGIPDMITTPAPWDALKKSHPSAKHPDVYLDILKRSALPGNKVLDPMCGSGMAGVAAEVLRVTHQLKWTMIDKSPTFCDLALTNVVNGYSNLMIKQKSSEEVDV